MLPALVLLALSAGSPEPILDLSDWPVKIGAEAQLFVDDYLISEKAGVAFRVHKAEKHPANPLIHPSASEQYIVVYGSVMREGGCWRMWYTNDSGLADAESADGLAWKRNEPSLLTRGHRGRSDTATILLNPDRSDLARKYLGYVMEYRYPDRDGVRERLREGIYLRSSPDGLQWKERPDPVMYAVWRNKEDNRLYTGFELGDVHHVYWDPLLHRFMGHIKIASLETGERMRGLAESEDGVHWSEPHLILRADERDQKGDQLYSMVAFPYESAWVALIGVYHKALNERMDIQLAFSRDGRTWTRPHRTPFLVNGREGSFDWGVLHMSNSAPILEDGQLRFYYGGFGVRHDQKARDRNSSGIGLATLRPDGFVSVDAGVQPGTLFTRPLWYRGGRLTLNAAIRPGGWIRVNGSLPVTGDGTALPVRWVSADRLPATADGNYVRLRFELKDAELYSFRIREN